MEILQSCTKPSRYGCSAVVASLQYNMTERGGVANNYKSLSIDPALKTDMGLMYNPYESHSSVLFCSVYSKNCSCYWFGHIFRDTTLQLGQLPGGCEILVLQWRHNWRDGVSNHQPHDCLLNRLFRRWSKKRPKLRVTGLCAGNSPVTGEFPAQMASSEKNVSIWWRHHVKDMRWYNWITKHNKEWTVYTIRKIYTMSHIQAHFCKYPIKIVDMADINQIIIGIRAWESNYIHVGYNDPSMP